MTELNMNLMLNKLNFNKVEQTLIIEKCLLNDYFNNLQVSEMSKNTYKRNLEKFIEWLNGRTITTDTLLKYREYLIKNFKARTINNELSTLKSFFNHLETKGYTNYAKNLKAIKINNKIHQKDSLTKEQVLQVLNAIDRTTLKGSRDYAILYLMFLTGLRQCEVVGAKIGDIKTIGNKRVLMVQGKGYLDTRDNISDYVELKPSVHNAIQDYLKYRKDAKDYEPLFTSTSKNNFNSSEHLTTKSLREIVKSRFKAVGIINERITTHSTRHTAITLALISGATLQETQALARHTNINTTMIYAHNLDRLSEHNAETRLENFINERGLN